MTITIVGLGLIGGSLAISLRESGFAQTLIGVDNNEQHAKRAVELSIVEKIMLLDDAVEQSDIIIVATPVNSLARLVPQILDSVKNQIVVEVGSTKVNVIQAVQNHPMRGNFVAAHPMAGTEYSGPDAAIPNLFDGKVCVLCDIESSNVAAVDMVKKLFTALKMQIVYLDAESHDVHTAYISHISHITSFALALTILEKERDEEKIFELAGGGFQSTVRLAKSNPDTWIPIFEQNRDNVLDVLDEHIHILSIMRSCLIKKKYDELYKMFEKANDIKRILK